MAELKPQKRGRRIAMSADEIGEFLAAEHTCRVATSGPDGPHVTALWFAWDGGCVWLYSLTGSQRWADVQKDPRISVLVDTGHHYGELRGVEISGTAEVVGDVPRTAAPVAELAGVEQQFARKYLGGGEMLHDERHAWLRVTPRKINSWDFRKLGG
jgi:nitroimidazol reductase NimA-like FMN-containing flavoprotein (pyridoxamine 5'-phosphate oxidase superfamily)